MILWVNLLEAKKCSMILGEQILVARKENKSKWLNDFITVEEIQGFLMHST